MPQVHSIRLTHPRLVFPDGEMTKPWTVCNPWANGILKIHMLSGKMLQRIKYPEEWGEMAPDCVDFMDLQDLSALCLDGFHMVQFWLDCKLKALLVGWARWYVYVDRVAAVGSRITLLLEDEDKAGADTEALAQQLWLAYKDYFGSRWVVEQPGLWGDRRKPETTYDDCQYEVEEGKLMRFTWYVYVDKEDERGAFGRLVDERMAAMPRMGEVFRTEPNGSDCLLWCKTNDTDARRKAATLRLWYPEQ